MAGPRLPWLAQIVMAAILTPAESFLAAHVSQTVCDYMDVWKRLSMTGYDLLALVPLVGLFGFVVWLKETVGLYLWVAVITSLLVALSVCMDVWQLRIP